MFKRLKEIILAIPTNMAQIFVNLIEIKKLLSEIKNEMESIRRKYNVIVERENSGPVVSYRVDNYNSFLGECLTINVQPQSFGIGASFTKNDRDRTYVVAKIDEMRQKTIAEVNRVYGDAMGAVIVNLSDAKGRQL
jgi:hypothetical protein